MPSRHAHRSAGAQLACRHPPRLLHPRGGVSEGLYASLNGGLGSSDDPARVRREPAPHGGAARLPGRGARQRAPSPLAGGDRRRGALAAAPRPRADGMATRRPGLALGDHHRRLRPGALRRSRGRRRRRRHAGWRGALAGVLEATLRAPWRGLGAEARAHRRGARADDRPERLRGRARIRGAVPRRRTPANARFFRPTAPAPAMRCSTCPAISARGSRRPASAKSPISASAPIRTRTTSSATAARPTAASPITAG